EVAGGDGEGDGPRGDGEGDGPRGDGEGDGPRGVREGDGRGDAVGDAVTAYAREDERGRYVVVLNFADAPASVSLGEPVEPTDLLTGDAVADGDEFAVADAVVLRAA
ncbi:Beta-galactosidase C-terminal domain, partial [Halorubrum sp. AD140]|uniref:Beta-galactosidase C-terminal domain n=1 Tax=Halorubrum sp. AD140 TaxID=3050073 RepID=UPI002ACD00F2